LPCTAPVDWKHIPSLFVHVRLVALLLPVALKPGWRELAHGRMDALVLVRLVEKASELLFESSIILIFSFVYELF
jgi:hypothetical protein